MEKKSDIVRRHVAAGEYKKALDIVKGFRLGVTKAESSQMIRAYECMINPGFYQQIGKDVEAEISEGIRIITALYGAKEEKPNVTKGF